MNALQLNAEIHRSLGILSEDENMLKRAAKYLKRLAAELTYDPTLMSKEEFFTRVEEAEREIAEGKGTRFTNKEEMNAWLNSL